MARRGGARHGSARHGEARQGEGCTGLEFGSWFCDTEFNVAWPGVAWLGAARQGGARQGLYLGCSKWTESEF